MVEHAWLQQLLPLLDQVDVARLLGVRAGQKRDEPEPDTEPDQAQGPQPPATGMRRNDDSAISAARQRFLERRNKSR